MRRYSRKKNSIKIFIAVIVAVAAIFAVAQYCLNSRSMGEVVAKVNGEKIYKSQIQNKLVGLLSAPTQNANLPEIDNLPSEVIEILAKEIYLDNEITKLAKKEGLLKDPEIKGRLHEARNKILRQAYVDALIKNEITDQTISEKYAELTNELQGKKEYQVYHIVVKTKAEAEKIAKELTAKKALKFADAAKKYSLDQESAAKGGELGYILEDNIIKEIAGVISNLKKDEVSAPIQTKFGWHLVKFTNSREAKALPFEAVKDNIKEQLIESRLSEINSAIMKDAKVEILAKKEEAKPAEEKAVEPAKEEVLTAPASEEKAMENSEEVKAEEKVEANSEEKPEAKAEEKTEQKAEVKKDEKSKSKKSKNKRHH